LYREVYTASSKVSKRDKLGIYAHIESLTLEAFNLCVEAVYKPKQEKRSVLETLRIRIETLKQLVRVTHEMNLMEEKKYILISGLLQEISKMTNGWIRYLDTQNPPVRRM
jgi:adenine-specific DNA methylase